MLQPLELWLFSEGGRHRTGSHLLHAWWNVPATSRDPSRDKAWSTGQDTGHGHAPHQPCAAVFLKAARRPLEGQPPAPREPAEPERQRRSYTCAASSFMSAYTSPPGASSAAAADSSAGPASYAAHALWQSGRPQRDSPRHSTPRLQRALPNQPAGSLTCSRASLFCWFSAICCCTLSATDIDRGVSASACGLAAAGSPAKTSPPCSSPNSTLL